MNRTDRLLGIVLELQSHGRCWPLISVSLAR